MCDTIVITQLLPLFPDPRLTDLGNFEPHRWENVEPYVIFMFTCIVKAHKLWAHRRQDKDALGQNVRILPGNRKLMADMLCTSSDLIPKRRPIEGCFV